MSGRFSGVISASLTPPAEELTDLLARRVLLTGKRQAKATFAGLNQELAVAETSCELVEFKA